MAHDPLCEASSGNPYAILANQISTNLVGWCSTCELIAKVRAECADTVASFDWSPETDDADIGRLVASLRGIETQPGGTG